MRVLVFLAIILLPACSTTQSDPTLGDNQPGVLTSSNAEYRHRNSERVLPNCRAGLVLVCDSDDSNAQCSCESRQRFRFERSLPRSVNVTQ